MLRFARAPDGSLGFDVRAQLPGRGAWTCAKEPCVRKALAKGAFERAFDEGPVLAQADELVSQVRATLENEAMNGLGLLKKSARLAAGRDDVARAFAAGQVRSLVLARDLSERSRRDVTEGRTELQTVTVATQERLGSAIGRKPTGVLALLDGPRAALTLGDLERLASFVPQRLAPAVEGA